MADGSIDPAVGRGRVRTELFRTRQRMKLTRQHVADSLGWSVSKVNRIESGAVGISQTDLKALLRLYGVDERDPIVAEMVGLARSSRHLRWSAYRDVLNSDYQSYLEYEGLARTVDEFALNAVPGALQSPLYLTAIVQSLSVGVDVKVTERRIEARLARQEILDRPDRPTLRFVIAEGALRTWVGSPGNAAAMREQIDNLVKRAAQQQVDIRVLPFSFGSHYGLAGGFSTLVMPDGHEDVLFREMARPSLVISTKEAAPYHALFDQLRGGSVPLEKLVDDLHGSFS